LKHDAITEVGKQQVRNISANIALSIINKVESHAKDISDALVLSAARVAKNLRRSEVEDRPLSMGEIAEIKALSPYFSKLMDKILPDLVAAVGANETTTNIYISSHAEKLQQTYINAAEANLTIDGMGIKQADVDMIKAQDAKRKEEDEAEILELTEDSKIQEIKEILTEQRESIKNRHDIGRDLCSLGLISASSDSSVNKINPAEIERLKNHYEDTVQLQVNEPYVRKEIII
jgi:hypothetical protein